MCATRLIPARAGNTERPPRAKCSCTAHPRSRGEHVLTSICTSRTPGSSPLARGTLQLDNEELAPVRLIPARAGNTESLKPTVKPSPAHPRSRGEHFGGRSALTPVTGSSPLARGTLTNHKYAGSSPRLIPARAGNTALHPKRARRGSAHPRSRGEHALIRFASYCALGSSPLARGTLHGGGGDPARFRLIPARAGNTFRRTHSSPSWAAHPRSRGEHFGGHVVYYVAGGSSPLARGTRLPQRGGAAGFRLIPARAGNTERG